MINPFGTLITESLTKQELKETEEKINEAIDNMNRFHPKHSDKGVNLIGDKRYNVTNYVNEKHPSKPLIITKATLVRALPKVKGKAAVKQAKRLRSLLRGQALMSQNK